MKLVHHVLKGSKRLSIPTDWIFFDCESLLSQDENGDTKHTFRFAVARYIQRGKNEEEVYHLFRHPLDLYRFIVSKVYTNRTLYVCCCNTDYDFRLSSGFSNLEDLSFYLHSAIVESGKFILHYRDYPLPTKEQKKTKGYSRPKSIKRITICDTLNWLGIGVAKMGELLGLDKLTMPDFSEDLDTWIPYCLRDVEITSNFMLYYFNFLERENLGKFSLTVASQSFSAFKSIYLKHDIEVHSNEPARVLERKGYFGGRVECFYIGTKRNQKFYLVDINSMYPYVMKSFPFPTRLRGRKCYIHPDDIPRQLKSGLMMLRCRVNTDKPIIPYRTKNGLCFPLGRFETSIPTPEYNYGVENGVAFNPLEACFYDCGFIFSNFVDKMYAMRQRFKSEGNAGFEYYTKILLNSLYGKFGQRNKQWEYVGDEDIPDFYAEEIYDELTMKKVYKRCIHGHIFISTLELDGFDSFPAIASHVTGYARVLLHQLIVKAGNRHVYYCDTDSLIVDETGFHNLQDELDDKELGKLKLEETATYIQIRSLKDYTFGKRLKIKGVGKSGIPLSGNVYRTEQWERFLGATRKGHTEIVLTRTVDKVLTRDYRKGTVTVSGWVEPLRY